MRIIYPASPNQALYEGLYHLSFFGDASDSRNGSVIVSKDPVMTIYKDPSARVLVGPTRNANPFFHIVEAMWMLAGRNDLKILTPFNKRFAEYSDDGGVTQPGAYGYRWRNHFGYDQLITIADELRKDSTTRRAVLQMWDGGGFRKAEDAFSGACDLLAAVDGSKDVPCNTVAYFDTLGDKLNMTVSCRSNDILWGAYGANVVHFSFLLEYMAAATGIPMGQYRQFSNNYHIYTDVIPFPEFRVYADAVIKEDVYTGGHDTVWKAGKPLPLKATYRVPLVGPGETTTELDQDIADAMAALADGSEGVVDIRTTFFRKVFWPMLAVHRKFKAGERREALEACHAVSADDWRAACVAWVQKRMDPSK